MVRADDGIRPVARFIVPDVRTSLGPDVVVRGKLRFSAPTRIDGRVHGEVRSASTLVVGPQAVVDGEVSALQVIVLGEVRGQVCAGERVEVVAGGRLLADIETPTLVIQDGALFEGRCRMGAGSVPSPGLGP